MIDAPVGSHVMVLEVEQRYAWVVPGDSMPIHQVRHPAELDDPVNLSIKEERLAAESLDGTRPLAQDVSSLGVTARGLNVSEGPFQVLMLDLKGGEEPAVLELDGRAQSRVTGNGPQGLHGGMQ